MRFNPSIVHSTLYTVYCWEDKMKQGTLIAFKAFLSRTIRLKGGLETASGTFWPEVNAAIDSAVQDGADFDEIISVIVGVKLHGWEHT